MSLVSPTRIFLIACLGCALAWSGAHASGPQGVIVADGKRAYGVSLSAIPGVPKRKPVSAWFKRRAKDYASVINKLYDVVKDESRVFSVVVPTSRALAGVKRQNKRYRTVLEQLTTVNENLTPGIHGVDALSTMENHVDEYLYFRTDHHWTALGAYYAYRSLAESAGFRPLSLGELEQRVQSRYFLGSIYRRKKSAAMRRRPDRVAYFIPPVSHEGVKYSRSRPRRPTESPFLREKLRGYKMFLGGDHPLMVANTSVQNGKSVMLVKNSYGNPFAIFLLAHYERVVVVDYRYQKKPLAKLVEEHEIDDLVFLNVSSLSASRSHQRHLKKLLRGRR